MTKRSSTSTLGEPLQQLKLSSVTAGYKGVDVIRDISLSVAPAEILAVTGRNGVGKTTLLRTIMGQAQIRKGSVELDGEPIQKLGAYRRARRGFGYVPQGRHIFPNLTGWENLAVAGHGSNHKDWKTTQDSVLGYFPTLLKYLNQKGGGLSGGQQQLLALARAMTTKPTTLLLDEPSEGVQPNIVDQIVDVISSLRSDIGISVVVVEQNLGFIEQFADRTLIMDGGRIVTETAAGSIASNDSLTHAFLGFGQ